MKIQIKCSECGKVHQVPVQAAGKTGTCSCGKKIKIPLVKKTTSSPQDFVKKAKPFKPSVKNPGSKTESPKVVSTKSSNKRKPFALATVALVALGFCFIFFTGGDKEKLVADDRSHQTKVDLWKYVPAGAHGLGRVNVQTIIQSGLVEKFLSLAEDSKKVNQPSPKELLEAINFDPLEDMDDLILVFYGEQSQDSEADAEGVTLAGRFNTEAIESDVGGVILAGRFNTEAIIEKTLAETAEVSRENIGDVPAVRFAKKDGVGYMAIADDELLFAGSEAFVLKALQLKEGAGATMNLESSEAMKKAESFKDMAFWLSTRVEANQEKKNQGSIQIGPDTSSVQHVVLGLDIGKGGFSFHSSAELASEADAEKMKADVQSSMMMVVGMVGLFTQGNADAAALAMELVQNIQLQSTGKTILWKRMPYIQIIRR